MNNCFEFQKVDSIITHLLEVMVIIGIAAQIKTDNDPAYVSKNIEVILFCLL